jgi:Zn-dependent metalloprotease
MRSFVSPGNAYDDPEIGKDPQIANISQLTDTTIPQSACGIGNKAFYETAQVLGVDRAWQIWFEALKQLAHEKTVTYRKWGHALLAASGSDRDQLLAALAKVGVDPNADGVSRQRHQK